jgi:hypothetical protein
VACWANEVEADVDASVVVGGQRAFDLELLLQVRLKLCVNVVNNSLVAVLLVNLVSVANRIDNGQFEPHVGLLQLVSVRLQLHGGQVVRTRLQARLKACVEQRVHQRRLANAIFFKAFSIFNLNYSHPNLTKLRFPSHTTYIMHPQISGLSYNNQGTYTWH